MGGDNNNKAGTIKYQKSYFDVLGLCCSSEVPLVENILKSLNGVQEFSVIVPTKTVIVVHDNLIISQLQIVKALNQARLEANIRVKGDTTHGKKWPSPFAIASGVLLLLSLLKYAYHPLRWLALGAVAIGIPPIFLKAIASLKNLRLDTNILILISVIGTIFLKDYVEAGFIVFLFTIAEWLESRASHKANAVMSSLMSITPQKAVIAETGEEIDADEVKLNTIIAVKAGEIIPIDGIVVDGNCEVDEKTLTGESFPVHKEKDSTVLAGSINLNGYISVKTTALAEDCVVAKMAKLVEQAQNSKSRAQRLIDNCAQYYTPAVIITSACLVVVPLALRVHNRSRWIHLALVVLVSACPCALILSTPVATFCGLTKAATSGVLIKGGDCLEILAKTKIMAFDKTGTITRGEFVVTEFKSLSEDISLHDLVYWVSSIESKSSHPMAAALVDHAKSLSVEPNPEIVTDFQNFPGEGINAKIDGKDIYIGNKKIGIRAGHASVSNQEIEKKGGKSVGYVYYGAALVGIFSLYDVCRIGASEAITKLKAMGIKTAMLTGDCQEAAMAAQRQLGDALEVIKSELLPEDKAKFIEEFKKEGTTAMIGDGVNDAPALATANIGISMGISGSALATETGDVILMSNDITKIPKVINFARKTRQKVIENVILSISTKSAILALAFAGHPLVWAAVLADVGTCLLVIFNSMLLLRETHHHHGGKCCKSSSSAATNAKNCHGNESSHHHNHCCTDKKVADTCGSHESSHHHNHCCTDEKVVDTCGSHEFSHHHNHCCTDEKVADTCGSHEFSHHHNHCCADEKVADTCNTHESHYHDSICQPSDSHVISSCEKDDLCSHLPDRHDDTVKHCHHGNSSCKPVDLEANNPHNHCHDNVSNHCISNHLNHTTDTKVADQNSTNKTGHCHSHKHSEDHVNIRVEDESSEISGESSSCVVKKCCSGHKSSLKCSSIVHVHKDTNHIETTKRHCLSLEKREIGGCCKSYMKECCGKQGQFATSGFCGGLPEIITE